MRRRFIAKNRKDFSFIIKLFLILVLSIFILSKVMSLQLFDSNEHFIMYMMEESNHLIETNLTYSNQIGDANILITNVNIKKPVTLFESNFVYDVDEEDRESSSSINNILFSHMVDKFNSIVTQTSSVEVNDPILYIYNTHQTEEYVNGVDLVYDFVPSVFTASYILKDSLEKKGIKTVVEDNSIKDYLNNNGLNYDDSYVASRYYLQQVMQKYPNVELFIDLHRDALSHDMATVEYNGKKYAKVLFVVGLDHDGYQKNLDLAKEFNKLILESYPFLTRGVLTKTGPLVNGVYNQDLSDRIILLEVGGNESSIDEVSNTIELISEIIYQKVGDRNV